MLVYMIPDVNGFSFCPGFRALLAILGSKIEGRDEKIAAGNRFGTEKHGCWRMVERFGMQFVRAAFSFLPVSTTLI